ncbi:hypothetical protein F0U44_17220 [Nocardioides humilatus]|uniref:Uncharacterized protein n=1 Tax=Nocardioides humilatus TaxID=2607660 RepID=A0A5B1L9G0_9ACTN|nr:hypothetical protein [Nocardioides humilatus]KAA1416924.1 hypothetical protein F0U44_17220 [Nocardioides humilatus]
MTDSTPGSTPDDATRHVLHASDPAHALPPITPDRLAAVLEASVNQTPTTSPRSNRRYLAYAAAAAVIVGGSVAGVALLGDDDGGDGGRKGDDAPLAKPTVTELALAAGPAAKCAAPDLSDVRAVEVAFEGTVTSIEDGVVTLEAAHFYTSPETDLVTVDEPDMNMSEVPVDFAVGQTYIVGATNGVVSICGLSGLATDELRAQYDEAFAS